MERGGWWRVVVVIRKIGTMYEGYQVFKVSITSFNDGTDNRRLIKNHS